jgi:hypothetical protein
MAGYIPQTPTKVPPDIDDLYDTMLSVHSKMPDDNFQNKQKSLQNLATILNLMDLQISLEKDAEILTVLTS